MAVAEFKEALQLLGRTPVLWIPGLIAGGFAALIWVLVMLSGTFFASRVLVIAALILVLFLAGMLVSIKENASGPATLVKSGIRYYFRMLLPMLIIIFLVLIIFFLLVATLALMGISSDPALLGGITFGIMIPVMIFTFFFDTAAVLEDRPVFGAIQRSVELVTTHFTEVIAFFVISALAICCILFPLMIIWEAFLYDKLEPLTRYTETQIQAITPDQLITLLGKDSIGITAAVLFIAGLLLIPVIYSYKACFFRKLAGSTIAIEQQVTGEYDSKGRWYKY
ncbi:hypothetical protein [uncultured Methanoregula sp.]|uniref:DUF7847 domain-containing protein n=1 Tax=uncultured Methanoregula sp. TaxID=1005933 RepID=UPI002AAB83AA|nr:hypothetical protein [uncultured Methanoregula sp.]